MVTCHNCGQPNAEGMRVCRYCGTPFNLRPQATRQGEYVPPSPLWNHHPHTATQVQPYPAQMPAPAGYRCAHCGSGFAPLTAKKISSDGWLAFALLLFFCPPFFWIGLLMKEEYRVCATCGVKFG